MTTTLGGALTDLVGDAQSLTMTNKRLYLDFAPPDTIPPYLTYNDGVSSIPALKGDGQSIMLNTTMQINLWQKTDYEDNQLVKQLVAILNGARLIVDGIALKPKVTVTSYTRIEEQYENELVHHEVTIEIIHPVGVH
jgi:hypothetical protein